MIKNMLNIPKVLLSVFKRSAAKEEPPFIVGDGVICRAWSRGNEVDPQLCAYSIPGGDADNPVIERLTEISQGRGLQTHVEERDDDDIRLVITGIGATQLMLDFTRVEDAVRAEAEAAKPKPPPIDPPNIKWPGSGASAPEHMQYLIDAREYISQMEVPEGLHYLQVPHCGGPFVGDKNRPAVLDASYDYRFFDENDKKGGRVFASISVPRFTPLEVDQWVDKQCVRAQGLSMGNIGDSFTKVLKEVGIEVSNRMKEGTDRFADTLCRI